MNKNSFNYLQSTFKCIVVLWLLVSVISIWGCDTYRMDDIGEIRLNISTYVAGKDQPTHPSVISFEKSWNGYRYWMTYTPYPYATGEEENPSIAVSNDLYKWETPKGMVNPIADNEETGCNELKDSHILFREDLDRIEVWYLGRLSKKLGGDGRSLMLFRKFSNDGKNWSNYEVMSDTQFISPSIYWDGNKYQMWGIGFDGLSSEGQLYYQESLDGKKWSSPVMCTLNGEESRFKIWHGAITVDKNKIHLTYVKSGTDSQDIVYAESQDGICFKDNRVIISNNEKTMWERLYRPCILIDNNNYYVFYGVITSANEWYISMSQGNKLDELTGIKKEDISKMNMITTTVTDTRSLGWKVHEIYDSMRKFVRFELLLLVPLIVIWMKKEKVSSCTVIMFTSIFLCGIYTYIRIMPMKFIYIISLIAVSIIEGVSIFCISKTLFKVALNKKGVDE